jgi:hypothetical protein
MTVTTIAPLQTLSLAETQDLSAIEAIEAAQEKRRAGLAAAAGAAIRRTGWLRAGLGVGAAAAGIGLGALLLCWGVSLLLGRPSVEDLAAVRRDAEARIAAAEQATATTAQRAAEADQRAAQAQQRAAAAERVAAEKGQAAEKATAEAQAILKKFEAIKSAPSTAGAKPTKSVVDFNIFRHQETGPLEVSTGWRYASLTDAAPKHQWCYVLHRANGLPMDIAINGKPLPFNPDQALRAGIDAADVQRALPLCDWFRGSNPNIREGEGARL